MSRYIVWDGNNIQRLFVLLQRQKVDGMLVGHYTQEWTSKPPHFTGKQFKIAINQTRDCMIAEGCFIGQTHAPSVGAFECQLQHCIAPQSHPAYRSKRSKLRMIAYYTGFMELNDICFLETKSKQTIS